METDENKIILEAEKVYDPSAPDLSWDLECVGMSSCSLNQAHKSSTEVLKSTTYQILLNDCQSYALALAGELTKKTLLRSMQSAAFSWESSLDRVNMENNVRLYKRDHSDYDQFAKWLRAQRE